MIHLLHQIYFMKQYVIIEQGGYEGSHMKNILAMFILNSKIKHINIVLL